MWRRARRWGQNLWRGAGRHLREWRRALLTRMAQGATYADALRHLRGALPVFHFRGMLNATPVLSPVVIRCASSFSRLVFGTTAPSPL